MPVRVRLQALSSKFPHRNEGHMKEMEQIYKDVLELSSLYLDVFQVRTLQIILVQIGSREVEKLVQYIANQWPSIELDMFIAEVIESCHPLR
ncbi:hypothetical protein BDZ94DRAFT_652657 [Collybia nuda]|uniref:Uncharacterized protein n=1 Tax=Collybia nuda TaxID=64659 RepID=A0A9P6CJS0_9AGAR|nr:hypothetical protein BDZ94DRAFT_652657 [Collybia nuda]